MSNENRGLLVILGVLIVVLMIGPVFMGGMMGAGVMGPGMMGWGYSGATAGGTGGWGWGLGMALGGLTTLAFWGALIVGIVLLARSVRGGSGSMSSEDPLTVLRRRYAAGEIDEATYERMRGELGDRHEPTATTGQVGATR